MSENLRLCTCCKKNRVPFGVEVCPTCTENAIHQFSGGISPFYADEVFIDSVRTKVALAGIQMECGAASAVKIRVAAA